MIKLLRVYAGTKHMATWNLQSLASSGSASNTFITNITGLNNVGFNNQSESIASGMYGTHVGRQTNNRNIGLTLDYVDLSTKYETDITLDSLFYSRDISLRFMMKDDREFSVPVNLDKIDRDNFSADTSFDISLSTPIPYFTNVRETSVDLTTNVKKTIQSRVSYPTPFLIRWPVTQLSNRLEVIVNGDSLLINGPFNPGDIIDVSTKFGNKYTSNARDGRLNITGRLLSGTYSLYLKPGDNEITVKPSVSGLRDSIVMSYNEMVSGL